MVYKLFDKKIGSGISVNEQVAKELNEPVIQKFKKGRVDQGKEFHNKLMQEWLDNNDILMYSIHNEGKSLIAKRFIKIWKVKIYEKKWQLMIANLLLLIWIN